MGDRRVILITGANRGIGKEVARQMAASAWQVVVAARDLTKASQAAAEIGNNAFALQLDVQDERSIHQATVLVAEKFGRLDVLVNNAAISDDDDILEVALDRMTLVMDTNLMGSIRTTKYFLPLLKKSDDARIINISSDLGSLATLKNGGYGAYRLSKVALNAFTIMLASALERTSVKAFSMSPGWVRTDMGGKNAPRSVERGAETVVWLATEKNIASGSFYRDKKIMDW